jgi:hypothetical protein
VLSVRVPLRGTAESRAWVTEESGGPPGPSGPAHLPHRGAARRGATARARGRMGEGGHGGGSSGRRKVARAAYVAGR